jgi:hypothetical protein
LDVRLQTKVDRGFFLADNDWTCYRRNYFQVSGSFSLEGVSVLYEGQELPCLVKDEHGNMNPVQDFMLGICGRLSDCDKAIPLIQHTAKRDKGPQTTPQPKVVRPGGNVSFSSVSSSQTVVTFERLQFKTATANNGKRRAAQQYYVIVFELLAKLTSGHIVPIASSKSAPVVVRGRSPGHYAESDSSNGSGRMASSHNLGVVRHHPYAAPPGHSAVAVAANTAPYPGANTDMFQPNEYMSYDYHSGVPYGNYGHMQPMPHSNHPYPGSGVPVMPQHQQQQQPPQQQHYVHDRTHHHPQHQEAYPSPHPNQNYEDHKLSGNEASNGNSSNNSNNNSSNASPYYWQRNDSTTNNNQQPPPSLHESNTQWSRVRMASNNSSSSVDSPQHNSPYINHAEHPYYSQQQHQAPYGGHPYAAGHPVSSPHGHQLPTR